MQIKGNFMRRTHFKKKLQHHIKVVNGFRFKANTTDFAARDSKTLNHRFVRERRS